MISIAGIRKDSITASPPPPYVPEVLTCTSRTITGTLKAILDKGMDLPLGAGHLTVLKQSDYRPNPDLGAAPAFLVDTKSLCKVNILTSRGEFGFTYGWKIIEGEVYVMGQIGEPDDDANR